VVAVSLPLAGRSLVLHGFCPNRPRPSLVGADSHQSLEQQAEEQPSTQDEGEEA
jgi:hypothetical protein